MKLYLIALIGAVSGQAMITAATNKDKLIAAIAASDINGVKKFLERLGPLDEHEKKELRLHAENCIDARQKEFSIFTSRPDAAKFLTGMALAQLGIAAVYVGVRAFVRHHSYTYLAPIGSFFTLYGFYRAYSGLFCETAHNRLKVAHKICAEIRNAEVKSELHVAKDSR